MPTMRIRIDAKLLGVIDAAWTAARSAGSGILPWSRSRWIRLACVEKLERLAADVEPDRLIHRDEFIHRDPFLRPDEQPETEPRRVYRTRSGALAEETDLGPAGYLHRNLTPGKGKCVDCGGPLDADADMVAEVCTPCWDATFADDGDQEGEQDDA